MAESFYKRTLSLYEEFQERQVESLKLDIQLNENQSENNVALQEYLLRLDEREKAAEESYRNISKRMEVIDDHVTRMHQKLNVLRDPAMLSTSGWSHSENVANPSLSRNCAMDTESNSDLNFTKACFESVSVQTDSLPLCKKCDLGFSIANLQTLDKNMDSNINASLPSQNIQMLSDNIDLNLPNHTLSMQENSKILGSSLVSQNVQNSAENPVSPSKKEKSMKLDNNPLCERPLHDANDKILSLNELASELKITEDNLSAILSPNLSKNQIQPNLVVDTDIENKSKIEIKISDSELKSHSSAKNILSASENLEKVVSKFDAVSLDEYDFLDTDNRKKTVSKRQDRRNTELEKVSLNSETKDQVKGIHLESKISGNTYKEPVLNQSVDEKSDSSISVTEPNSPAIYSGNTSNASDSGGIYEKMPLTESAAYKALLGETVATDKIPVQDSESEDDVEIALAHSVTEDEKKSESSIQKKKVEKNMPSKPVDVPKLSTRTNTVSSKPKPKLSKSTRKVLGLDSSSGSEVELPVKLSVSKNDDSDYDFFD